MPIKRRNAPGSATGPAIASIGSTSFITTAEEALHDAFRAALEQWPRDGVPSNPRSWLVSAGRFKAIDGLRRRARFDPLDEAGAAADIAVEPDLWTGDESVEDDRLRLIFT